MLPTSLPISPAAGNIQSPQEPVPTTAPLAAGENMLDQLLLNQEQFPAEVFQAMSAFHWELKQGDIPGVYITPPFYDGSQVAVDFNRAGQVTLFVLVPGNTPHMVVVTPTHPAWGHISAIPEQKQLITEWNAWAKEICREPENRQQVKDAMVECLLAGGKELRISGMFLSSLPKHLPPGLTVLDVSKNKLSRLPELPRTLNSLNASFNQLISLPRYPGGLQSLDIRCNNLNMLSALPLGLKTLNASDNYFTRLPILPMGMTALNVSNNLLATLPKLPRDLTVLNVKYNKLAELPVLPEGLRVLNFSGNTLTHWPELPCNLSELIAKHCSLDELPTLPATLQVLNVSENLLTALPALPPGLTVLKCNSNRVSLPKDLPNGLKVLHVENNWMREIPALPDTLLSLNLNNNLMRRLPNLPNGLLWLSVENTSLTRLPTLPNTLTHLNATNAGLRSLPKLPNNLQVLDVSYNPLEALPELPRRIKQINASHDDLTWLPELPASLEELYVDYNDLTLIPRLPEGLKELDISNNDLSHLPARRAGLWMECSGNPVEGNPLSMVTSWFTEQQHADALWTWRPLLQEANGEAFANFLVRLTKNISARTPAFRACVSAWLNHIAATPDLRERTFGIALEASESCNDRAALGWNSMQTLRLLHDAEHRPGGMSPQAFQTLARQVFLIQRIEAHAADVVRHLPEGTDAVEIYLYFFCQLKARLGLPDIFAQVMDFPGLHSLTQNDITFAANMLTAAEQRDYTAWFYDWEPLQHYLQREMTPADREALSIRRLDEYEAQLDRLKIEHQQLLDQEGALQQLGRQATAITNEIIFGPLARAQFSFRQASTERPAETVFFG